jgi:hypothetical protein
MAGDCTDMGCPLFFDVNVGGRVYAIYIHIDDEGHSEIRDRRTGMPVINDVARVVERYLQEMQYVDF